MKCVVVLLSLLSVGCSAPVSSCESLTEPITISKEEMLGRWLYIGGSTNFPGSRSLGHLLTNVWLNISETSESNILKLIQTQRIFNECSSLMYNVTFENSTMLVEQPFHLKEVYLPTDCSDCLVVHEEVIADEDKFTSLLLFSRGQNVSADTREMLIRQAKCLNIQSPIMLKPNNEICPDNTPSLGGLRTLNPLFEAKRGHQVLRFLDTFFDLFVNDDDD
ncbi:uncharacterized protein [Paralichthys olivaceus]|uniref:uncharacterized protein n=1 Tax=Paralichthys olivaceus TaxID=8255 RepID=UPI00097CE7CC|nr:PREDICTED: uncharacterized protein LOC109637788 [Paralichthys olivaceus]